MATELAKAYVQIIPSAQGIKGNLESTLSEEVSQAGDSAGKNFGSKFLKVGAGVIAAGTAAVTAAAGAVWSAANNTAQMGDEIDKTSQKIGVSAEQYQAMAFAAEHCGFEVSTFQTAAKNLAKTDFQGNMTDAINTIMELDDVSERTAMAQELFGTKAAQSMAALLNGEDDLEDYKNQLADIGGLMSDEAVSASAAFEDSLTNLQTAFQGLGNGLMGDFLPSITQVMDGLTMLLNGDDGGLALIKDGIDGFLSSLEEMIPKFVETATDIISSFSDAIIDNLPEIIALGLELIIKLAIGIIEALPELIAKVPEIIKAIVDTLIEHLPDIMDAGENLIKGLWEGIKNAKDWLLDKISGFVDDVVDGIKDFFGIASPSKLLRDEVGQWLPKGIAVGIETNADSVEDAMGDLSKLASNAFSIDDVAASRNYRYSSATNGNGALVELLSEYLPLIAEGGNVNVTLEGDAGSIFKSVRQQNKQFMKQTGVSAFA